MLRMRIYLFVRVYLSISNNHFKHKQNCDPTTGFQWGCACTSMHYIFLFPHESLEIQGNRTKAKQQVSSTTVLSYSIEEPIGLRCRVRFVSIPSFWLRVKSNWTFFRNFPKIPYPQNARENKGFQWFSDLGAFWDVENFLASPRNFTGIPWFPWNFHEFLRNFRIFMEFIFSQILILRNPI